MKTVELTEREIAMLYCLVGIERNNRKIENWKMDAEKTLTEKQIEKYNTNLDVLSELSVLCEKLNK